MELILLFQFSENTTNSNTHNSNVSSGSKDTKSQLKASKGRGRTLTTHTHDHNEKFSLSHKINSNFLKEIHWQVLFVFVAKGKRKRDLEEVIQRFKNTSIDYTFSFLIWRSLFLLENLLKDRTLPKKTRKRNISLFEVVSLPWRIGGGSLFLTHSLMRNSKCTETQINLRLKSLQFWLLATFTRFSFIRMLRFTHWRHFYFVVVFLPVLFCIFFSFRWLWTITTIGRLWKSSSQNPNYFAFEEKISRRLGSHHSEQRGHSSLFLFFHSQHQHTITIIRFCFLFLFFIHSCQNWTISMLKMSWNKCLFSYFRCLVFRVWLIFWMNSSIKPPNWMQTQNFLLMVPFLFFSLFLSLSLILLFDECLAFDSFVLNTFFCW